MRPWTVCFVSSARVRSSCFNGATALRPWTVPARRKERTRVRASMGPRPCGRGRVCLGGHVHREQGGLQWGHGLAAVDGRGRGRPPMSSKGFNGATALRPWTERSVMPVASTRMCFNGATALRPWTVGERLASRFGCGCFNGATALRPWTECPSPGFAGDERLQWGHGLAAVDGQSGYQPPFMFTELQWGHGLAAVDGGEGDQCMTAETALQWGHGLAAVDGIPPTALTLESC